MQIISVKDGRYFYCYEDEEFIVFDMVAFLKVQPLTNELLVAGKIWSTKSDNGVQDLPITHYHCDTFLRKCFSIVSENIKTK